MLAPGATIDVQFLLSVQRDGAFRFLVNVEALPSDTPSNNADGAATGGSTKTPRGARRKQ